MSENAANNNNSIMEKNQAICKEAIVSELQKKKVHLFYCLECEELARNIASESDHITLQSINWRSFADGFPNLFINNAHEIRGQHVAFLASFSSPAVIFEQISVIYLLPRLFVASFTLVLPFFPTGSFERMEEEGDERFYFADQVLPLFETGIPLLTKRLQQLPETEKIIVAFPDDGAWKRFHKLLDQYPTVVCTKVREGDKRIVRLKEGNPAGCHVVIVDDLVQSGGTLIECQKVLAAHGAAKVSAYVTHGVFPKSSWERFTHKNNGSEEAFAYFWITDSCPQTVKSIGNKAPFEVLSLAGSIAGALQI
ncbi:BnaC03g23950D [Brassica napus]|uniref:BnaC03g23950D protein n=1 Tax=Brassica napus TaxID=3708 RepID=A0A078HYR8_BRANA|nr:BnaC03g23950D [Brassica napus]